MKDSAQRIVMFAMPCYNQQVWSTAMVSLYGAMHRITARGWGCGIECFGGHGGIHIIRNWFCQKFLESPCTDLFFIDSDIAADPDAYVKLIEHPVDVVLGLYRSRMNPEVYAFLGENLHRDPATGLVAIRSGPAGFLRIRRHVIEKMAAGLRDDEWSTMPLQDLRIPTIFDFKQRNGHYLGEDTNFFLKWEEMGGNTWIDPDIELSHWGATTYTSTFSTFLAGKEREARERHDFEALTNGR
jgi:hypothetical protein